MSQELDQQVRLAQPLAPEDVTAGSYVMVLQKVATVWPSLWMWDGQRALEPQHVAYVPFKAPRPLRVLEVCLPLVFVENSYGKFEMLDLRRCRLARLGRRFGETAFKKYAQQRDKEKSHDDKDNSESKSDATAS